ncbi:DUF1491 family protein [Rhodobium gokarnense]|uniref:DUF1491 family protein n=1 Tax=Rhodobium gokarnense TaxID=364296 RepID=A0ABT3HC06_9HYPH|nr:DUF1491 family protein [Rhodobium gokarnense]MCW2307912.1 hypothetical protein [Rhodobium gokarnense]
MRVTSSLWVGAYVRRCFAGGAMAAICRRGAEAAGAIYLKINRLDGSFDLYGPAPQAMFDEERPRDRRFEALKTGVAEPEVDGLLDREQDFDPDIWVVEVEDRQGRAFLDDG